MGIHLPMELWMTHSLLLLLKLRLLLHLTWGTLHQPSSSISLFEVFKHCRKQQHMLLLDQASKG